MRDGGDGSFEAFVAERSTTLLRTAYLLTGDRGHAEDLLQTALITAYRHWGRIDHDDPTAFVRRVLVTTHASWRRLSRVSEFVSASPLLSGTSGLPGFAQPRPDVGERDEMTRALATLPPRMRAVLVLRYWEDLSEAGTAEVLGCSVDTVKTHTSRGLARLHQLLDDTAGTTTSTTGPGRSAEMDIETRLRHDLAGRAGDISAPPADLYEHVLDGHRTQRRHRTGLLAIAAALLAIAVLVPLTVGSNGPSVGGPTATTAPGAEAGYVPWDVAARGSLAGDAAYLQALLEEPWSSLPGSAGPPVETRHVVYAGEVGGETEALVIGWQDGGWQGIWREGQAGAAAADLAATGGAQPLDPDFITQYTGRVLLLIGRPGDTIEVSPRQDIAADGSIVPAPFVSVADIAGVGTVDGAPLGTVRIRATRDGQVVVDQVLHGGQETREGTADQLDLSAALAAAAGEPEEPMVRLMVQGVLNQTGVSAADVTVGVRWGGPIGNRNLAATAAVVTVGMPSGATILLGSVGSEQGNGDTWVSIVGCGQAVLPAGTDIDALLVGMRCDPTSIEDGAGPGSQVVVVPPVGTASLQLTDGSGGVLDTRELTGPAYVGAAPDGLAGITALDAAGGVMTEAPLLGMADLQAD